jgi:ribosomal protein S24E
MTDKIDIFCIKDDCKMVAFYNYPNKEIAEYCEQHYEIGMADFRDRKCRYINTNNEQCHKYASYGIIGSKTRLFCKECSKKQEYFEKDIIDDIAHKKCSICNKIRPSYGNSITRKPIYCYECYNKLDEELKKDIEQIVSKKCVICDKIQPSYGLINTKKPTHCYNCYNNLTLIEKNNMEDIINKNKKCIVCNTKRPSYGKIESKQATHCAGCYNKLKIHDKNIMEELASRKCIICKYTQPSYGKIGTTQRIYCRGCYNNLSVEDKGQFEDVAHIKCIMCNKIRPSYGLVGTIYATHCSNCYDGLDDKTKKAIEQIVSKKCIGCNKKQPSYGLIGTKRATHCYPCYNGLDDITKDVMEQVVSKKCISPMCETIISNKKYKGYCFRCFIHTFPDEQNSRNYKTKEKTVVDYITETFKDYKILNDKVISGGCSRRRPDILIDVETHCIIIEIDEDAHINYTCENKRMMEISQDLGHPNIVFIRFNPDAYINNEGKKVKSCWKVNKNGICVIDNKNKWNERLDNLKKLVEYWLKNIPEKHITIEKLYYTKYAESNVNLL